MNKMDKAAFEELFRSYFTPLCSFAQKYVRDIDEAKDIVHNVFINLWNKRDQVDLNTSLKSYLFQGVQNRCLNYIRDRKKFVQFDTPQSEAELVLGHTNQPNLCNRKKTGARLISL